MSKKTTDSKNINSKVNSTISLRNGRKVELEVCSSVMTPKHDAKAAKGKELNDEKLKQNENYQHNLSLFEDSYDFRGKRVGGGKKSEEMKGKYQKYFDMTQSKH